MARPLEREPEKGAPWRAYSAREGRPSCRRFITPRPVVLGRLGRRAGKRKSESSPARGTISPRVSPGKITRESRRALTGLRSFSCATYDLPRVYTTQPEKRRAIEARSRREGGHFSPPPRPPAPSRAAHFLGRLPSSHPFLSPASSAKFR